MYVKLPHNGWLVFLSQRSGKSLVIYLHVLLIEGIPYVYEHLHMVACSLCCVLQYIQGAALVLGIFCCELVAYQFPKCMRWPPHKFEYDWKWVSICDMEFYTYVFLKGNSLALLFISDIDMKLSNTMD